MSSHPEMHSKSAGNAQTGNAERRRWPRVETDLSITLVLDGREHQAKLRDVSRAGVCFFLDRQVPMMTVLALSMDLPERKGVRRIRGQGAVVRCEKISPGVSHYEIALYLHDMTESDREALDEHVKSR